MATSEPDTTPAGTFGERLAAAMGWDAPPRLTEAQRAEVERRNAEAEEAADRFYAGRAAA